MGIQENTSTIYVKKEAHFECGQKIRFSNFIAYRNAVNLWKTGLVGLPIAIGMENSFLRNDFPFVKNLTFTSRFISTGNGFEYGTFIGTGIYWNK